MTQVVLVFQERRSFSPAALLLEGAYLELILASGGPMSLGDCSGRRWSPRREPMYKQLSVANWSSAVGFFPKACTAIQRGSLMPNALSESQWKRLLKDNPSIDDPGLADVLQKYAKANDKDVDERLEVLDELISLAEEIKKQSTKSRIRDVTSYLNDVLTEAQQEVVHLENEDDGAMGLLDDEEAYGMYLKKTLKRLRKRPMYFAAALGRKPHDHKIIFHKVQDGKKLLKALKAATDLKKFVWGLAGAHAQEKTTLTLGLEGPQVAALKKKLELLLKYYKPLPFDTILLMVDGKVVEDLSELDDLPTDDSTTDDTARGATHELAATRLAALKKMGPTLEKAIETHPERRSELLKAVAAIREAIQDEQWNQSQTELLALGKLLRSLVPTTS